MIFDRDIGQIRYNLDFRVEYNYEKMPFTLFGDLRFHFYLG